MRDYAQMCGFVRVRDYAVIDGNRVIGGVATMSGDLLTNKIIPHTAKKVKR